MKAFGNRTRRGFAKACALMAGAPFVSSNGMPRRRGSPTTRSTGLTGPGGRSWVPRRMIFRPRFPRPLVHLLAWRPGQAERSLHHLGRPHGDCFGLLREQTLQDTEYRPVGHGGHSVHSGLLPSHFLRAIAGVPHVRVLPLCKQGNRIHQRAQRSRGGQGQLGPVLPQERVPQRPHFESLSYGRSSRHQQGQRRSRRSSIMG